MVYRSDCRYLQYTFLSLCQFFSRENGQNTRQLEVRHFRMIWKWSPTSYYARKALTVSGELLDLLTNKWLYKRRRRRWKTRKVQCDAQFNTRARTFCLFVFLAVVYKILCLKRFFSWRRSLNLMVTAGPLSMEPSLWVDFSVIFSGHGTEVPWFPEVFPLEVLERRRRERAKSNAREPLGTHVRYFERADPIRSRFEEG